jgi:putative glutathione S-transferase
MSADATQEQPAGSGAFDLGKELAEDGRWVRQDSAFRRWVTADGSSGFPAEAGRYHLYVCLCCPWSHRSVIGRLVKGLEDATSVSYVHPYRDERGWAFPGGDFVDEVNGFSFISEAYAATDPSFDDRYSIPVLWDKETGQIVSNESGEILRMLGTQFEAFATTEADLYPEEHRAEIDRLDELIYEHVNNGVYNAGFSTRQDVYEEAARNVFVVLDELEERLGHTRYLVSEEPTEVDWRLFVTLVRFDSVYYQHFRCNLRRIVDYPNLWAYARDLYQLPGIAATVSMPQIKEHYFTTHDMINPSRIIPVGPELDFLAPHGRG